MVMVLYLVMAIGILRGHGRGPGNKTPTIIVMGRVILIGHPTLMVMVILRGHLPLLWSRSWPWS